MAYCCLEEPITRVVLTVQTLLMLLDGFRLPRRCSLAYALLFPVLTDPGFPALARLRIAPAKRQRRDIAIRELLPRRAIAGHHPYKACLQRRAAYAIENVALGHRAILASYGHIAAIIERRFQRLAHILIGGQLRHPALHAGMREPRRNFQLFGIELPGRSSMTMALGVTRGTHACVSSICAPPAATLFSWIWISGL